MVSELAVVDLRNDHVGRAGLRLLYVTNRVSSSQPGAAHSMMRIPRTGGGRQVHRGEGGQDPGKKVKSVCVKWKRVEMG